MSLNDEQPKPKPGAARPTWELVIEDMHERSEMGARKYGVHHQHDNGRDHLVDAYQESLDQALYLRAEIERRRSAGEDEGPSAQERASTWRGYVRGEISGVGLGLLLGACVMVAADGSDMVGMLLMVVGCAMGVAMSFLFRPWWVR